METTLSDTVRPSKHLPSIGPSRIGNGAKPRVVLERRVPAPGELELKTQDAGAQFPGYPW